MDTDESGGNDDFYFEDLLQDYEDIDVPEDFYASEAETFASLLSIHRAESRKSFTDSIHKRHFLHSESKSEKDTEQRTIIRDENYDKNRESIVQTYRDFLEYKKHSRNQSRIEEYQRLGYQLPTKKNTRLSRTFDGVPVGKKKEHFTGQRRHSDELVDYNVRQYSKIADDWSDMLSDSPMDFSASPKHVIIPEISSTSEESDDRCPVPKDKYKLPDKSLDPKVEYLVKDKYYPGLLDDAVNRKVNYYQMCFDLSFEDSEIPTEEPDDMLPSLIEAFDIRLKLEMNARQKETETSFGIKRVDDDDDDDEDDAAKKAESSTKSFLTYLKKIKIEEQLLNREEVRVANAVEIDLLNVVRNRPASELIQAINSLFKAEIMNEFDKSQQEAEEAFKRAPPEFAESAAVYRAEMFRPTIKDRKKKSHAVQKRKRQYHPIEVVCYMGVTKPNQSDDKNPFIEMSYSRTKI